MRPGLLRIPAYPGAQIALRFAPVRDRDVFDPSSWANHPLTEVDGQPGWFELDLDALAPPDGVWEYEFLLAGDARNPIPDPYANQITRFGGYRGVITVAEGVVSTPPFRWDDELSADHPLVPNDQLVICEVPLRWMTEPSGDTADRQIGLGTFDEMVFERLDDLVALGVTAIELLPIAASPDTLNWGYGTRFFLAPDFDMGSVADLRYLIKRCHQRGIRVLLDVVMNHSNECPLERLDRDRFYLRSKADQPDRWNYGGVPFEYRVPDRDGYFPAREFQCQTGEYWVREYHVDGFRIDAFKDIDQWDFIQEFADRARTEHARWFPDRPFYVVAEDSWFRTQSTRDDPGNPRGRAVVDAVWSFPYADECRRLLVGELTTAWGQPSRRARLCDSQRHDALG
jgi:1,4-alpha-glucan branching enzyme